MPAPKPPAFETLSLHAGQHPDPVTGARAVLGLCGSPGGLDEAASLRKYIGRSLDAIVGGTVFDVEPLAEQEVETASSLPTADAREQLLTVSDPNDLLGFYLSSTQRFPLLSADEEIQLAKVIEAGVFAEEALAKGGRMAA